MEPIEITAQTTELPPRKVLLECGHGSHLIGNRPGVDWDYFYDLLEIEGWDMQDLGGPIDEKIRRIVRKAIREGEIE